MAGKPELSPTNLCANCGRHMILRGASVVGGAAAECPLHAAAGEMRAFLTDYVAIAGDRAPFKARAVALLATLDAAEG